MPPFGPIKRRHLIAALRRNGFQNPFSGNSHEFMIKEALRVRVPNPHGTNIGKSLLLKILHEVGIDRDSWEGL